MYIRNSFKNLLLLLIFVLAPWVCAAPVIVELDHSIESPMGSDDLIQNVNIFSATGRDPRVLASTLSYAKMLTPIGKVVISAKKKIPWLSDNRRLFKVDSLESGGFLISPCLVLTNYHAVFGESKKPSAKLFPTTFEANRRVRAEPVAWGPKAETELHGSDWAILKLGTGNCLGLEVGWMELSLLNPSRTLSTPMTCAGFPGEKGVNGKIDLWVDPTCRIKEFPPDGMGTLLVEGATTSGHSGGWMGYFDDNGVPHFTGLHTGSRKGYEGILKAYDRAYANVAINPNRIKNLDELIAEDIKANGSPRNPLVDRAKE